MKKKLLIIVFLMASTYAFSQVDKEFASAWDKMHESKGQALDSFNQAKFGMFIHWGAYSRPAGIWKGQKIRGLGEWIFHDARISREDYKKMCSLFNPVGFNADEWVKLARDAGMKYIVAMPKHHDGFAMYDSKVSNYNIMDATTFGRDPMEELYRACQKYGIRFSIYYSHATDWMDGGDAGVADYMKDQARPNASDSGSVSPSDESESVWPSNTWDPAPVSFTDYLEKKSKPQVIELLKKFPSMQEIWYDVPRYMTPRQSFEFYKLAYDIQPSCLINSRVGNGMGDFFIPGDNKIPDAKSPQGIYWETPGTLNDTWGFKSYDVNWKTTDELLFWIAEIASKGGNYLLNVGPDGNGVIPAQSVKLLEDVGAWMKTNGDAIYGTHYWSTRREGPTKFNMKGRDEDGNLKTENGEKIVFDFRFTPRDFWFTAKENYIYVISLSRPENNMTSVRSLSGYNKQIKSVRLLGNMEPLKWKISGDAVDIFLPEVRTDDAHGFALKIEMNK